MTKKEITMDDIFGCGFAKDSMDTLETITALTIDECKKAQPAMFLTLDIHLAECETCRKRYEALPIMSRKP